MDSKNKLLKITFQLLVFLIPSQLAYHFWPSWAHVFGIRVDYLAPTVYLTDVLIFLIITLSVFKKKFFSKQFSLLLVFLSLFALINTLSAKVPGVALIKWIKVFELVFLGFIVKNNKLLKPKVYFQPLSFSLIFFSLIGIVQFLLGRTIGGPFYLLGERVFNLSTPGISLFAIFGKEYLRAYSTFPHPNALSGYFLVAVLILLSLSFKKYKKLFYTALFFAAAGIILSFSMAATLGTILVLAFYLIFKKNKELFKRLVIFFFFSSVILSVVSPVFLQKNKQFFEGAQETYFKRFALTLSAGEIISRNPFGIGLNNFLLELPRLSLYPKVSWWIQPVHNVFLLVLSETGLVGLLIFLYLFYKSLISTFTRKSPALTLAILMVLLTGLFDHYWLTLQQNEILFSILLGLSLRKNKR